MPTRAAGQHTVDYADSGEGRATLLLHSSASGPAQWRALSAELSAAGGRRLIAPRLMGYGDTSRWSGDRPQRLADQAALVAAVLEDVPGPVDVVGHSFGAQVGLEVALGLGGRLGRMVLFEPNTFALLHRPGHEAELAEIQALHAHVRETSARGDWHAYAARFADYFSGEGTWDAMPEVRQQALAGSLHANPFEWEAVFDPQLTADRWSGLSVPVLLCWARDTRRPLRAIADILLAANPGWERAELPRGGHMAPLVRPRPFNAEVLRFFG